jgi:hypothetical protein
MILEISWEDKAKIQTEIVGDGFSLEFIKSMNLYYLSYKDITNKVTIPTTSILHFGNKSTATNLRNILLTLMNTDTFYKL